MTFKYFLIFMITVILACCNGRTESKVDGKQNLFNQQEVKLSKEDSIKLHGISNKISELVILNGNSIQSDNELQGEIEILIDSALSIDQNDFLTNYNYFIYTGMIENYEKRLDICRKLYRITKNPTYLNALIHAFLKLDRMDSISVLTMKAHQIIESKIAEHPEDFQMRINKLTLLCLTSSNKNLTEYFELLRSEFKGNTLLDGLYHQYQEDGCLIFVPK